MNLIEKYCELGCHVRVYHHYDADGHAAAAVVGAHFIEHDVKADKWTYKTDLKYYNTNYNKPMVTDWMNTSEREDPNLIFIVDYSTTRPDDLDMLKTWMNMKNVEIVWIDHHETIKALIEANPEIDKIPGIRIFGTKYAGCALTYFFMLEERWGKPLDEIFDGNGVRDDIYDAIYHEWMPKWCMYTSDNDTYTNEFRSSTFFVGKCYYDGCWNTYVSYAYKDSCLTRYYDVLKEEKHLLKNRPRIVGFSSTKPSQYTRDTAIDTEWIKFGELLREIDDKRNGKLVSGAAYPVNLVIDISRDTIENKLMYHDLDDKDFIRDRYKKRWTGLCLNSRGNSYVFGEEFRNYDFVSLYSFDGDNYSYSMFSKDPDGAFVGIIGLLMKHIYQITGGGHEHAAGWTGDYLVWRKKHDVLIMDSTSSLPEPKDCPYVKSVDGVTLYEVKKEGDFT